MAIEFKVESEEVVQESINKTYVIELPNGDTIQAYRWTQYIDGVDDSDYGVNMDDEESAKLYEAMDEEMQDELNDFISELE